MTKITFKDIFTKNIIIFLIFLFFFLLLFAITLPSWIGAKERAEFSNIKVNITHNVKDFIIDPNISEFYIHQDKNNPNWKKLYDNTCTYDGRKHPSPCVILDDFPRYKKSKKKNEIDKLADLIVSYEAYIKAKGNRKKYAGCVLYKIDKALKYTEKDKIFNYKFYYIDEDGEGDFYSPYGNAVIYGENYDL